MPTHPLTKKPEVGSERLDDFRCLCVRGYPARTGAGSGHREAAAVDFRRGFVD